MADSYVCSGATMKCTMGTSTARLTVLPIRTVFLTGQPMANISDHLTMVNLAPFGRCRSLGFPATAAATAAHHGHLTPMPCMHNTPFPWMNGKNDYIVKGDPALLKSSTCQCMWGGTISLVTDGQAPTGSIDMSHKPAERFMIKNSKLISKQTIDNDHSSQHVADFITGVGAKTKLSNVNSSSFQEVESGTGASLLSATPSISEDEVAKAPLVSLEHWNVIRQKDNMFVYEMKDSKAALKPPERGQVPNSFVIMYHKDSDKIQGIKSITHFNDDGVRDYEIHTTDHKGLGSHYHVFKDGKLPVGEPQSLTPELKNILDVAKNV